MQTEFHNTIHVPVLPYVSHGPGAWNGRSRLDVLGSSCIGLNLQGLLAIVSLAEGPCPLHWGNAFSECGNLSICSRLHNALFARMH